jgi:ribose 5-phosphate isomerase A
MLGEVRVRPATPPSPDGGVIADYHGAFDDPRALAERLTAVPGVVEHGLFAATIVSDVLIARGREVEHRHVVVT